MSKKIVVILRKPPHGSLFPAEGLPVAVAVSASEAKVISLGDSVYAFLKGTDMTLYKHHSDFLKETEIPVHPHQRIVVFIFPTYDVGSIAYSITSVLILFKTSVIVYASKIAPTVPTRRIAVIPSICIPWCNKHMVYVSRQAIMVNNVVISYIQIDAKFIVLYDIVSNSVST